MLGDISPKASQVDLVHPDTGVEVVAVKLVIKDKAEISN